MSDEEVADQGSSSPGAIQRFFQIPCMRRSLLYGIGGGISTGLAVFLFTSNVRKATNLAVGSYAILATLTWSLCRYDFAQQRFQQRVIKEAMEKAVFQQIKVDKSFDEETN